MCCVAYFASELGVSRQVSSHPFVDKPCLLSISGFALTINSCYNFVLEAVTKAAGSVPQSDLFAEIGYVLRSAPYQPGGSKYKNKEKGTPVSRPISVLY